MKNDRGNDDSKATINANASASLNVSQLGLEMTQILA